MSDEKNRKRLARLVEAIDKESPAEGLHGDDVEELYELATKSDLGEPTPDVPRYLGCASEGHWESAFRSNPDFTIGTAEELEAWLAGNYREGWAGRWVVDLETGQELSWNTSCEFDQEVERAEPKAEPAYTPDDAPVCIERRYLGGFERLTYREFVTQIVMGDEVAAVVARRMLDGDSPYPWNEEDPEHASQFVLLDAEALRAALSEAEAS